MRAYVLNLDRAADRLAHCRDQLEKLSIPWERIRGVEGAKVPAWSGLFDERRYRLWQGRRKISGEVGCYLSHLKALKTFLKSDEKAALILEDDVHLDDDLTDVLSALQKRADDWDMVRLSTVNHGKSLNMGTLTRKRNLVLFWTREKGAGAYVVNRRAASIMLKAFKPMWLPWDHIFDMEWLYGYRTVFVSPYPVRQVGFETQIQHNVRSYYLPAWKRYWTVFPFRAFVELTRFGSRISRFVAYRFSRTP